MEVVTVFSLENCDREKLHNAIMDSIQSCYAIKEQEIDPNMMRQLEKMIMLQVVDNLWKDHLLGMDHLKDGVGLRGYAQKNPLTEYKKEGFEMFSKMMHQIREGVTEYLFKVQIEEGSEFSAEQNQSKKMVEHRGASSEESKPLTVRRDEKKVGSKRSVPLWKWKKIQKMSRKVKWQSIFRLVPWPLCIRCIGIDRGKIFNRFALIFFEQLSQMP